MNIGTLVAIFIGTLLGNLVWAMIDRYLEKRNKNKKEE